MKFFGFESPRKKVVRRSQLTWCLFLIQGLFLARAGFAQPPMGRENGIGLRLPGDLDPRTSILRTPPRRGMSMAGYPGVFENIRPRSYVYDVKIDSTGRYVIASETFLGNYLRLPQVLTLQEYIQLNQRLTLQELWRDQAVASLYEQSTTGRHGPGGLSIDIPVPIRSQAFQKIFGGNTVGLNVQGDIRIEGGFRNEKRSEVRTSIAQGSNTNFKMNQTQRFTVTGRIGEKVTVNVDQDSERAFEFDNNIKLNYKGFEDEIIQNIEAGNISLSLPATRFVTFSGKSTGLFGVKMDMQLGDLHMTTIASQEKGQSQKLSIGGGAKEGKQQIKDYDYRRFTYFFLDNFYRSQYRFYSTKWTHIYDPNRAISRIEVYKSRAGYENDEKAIRGWALLDPNNAADTLNVSDKEVYRGHFIRMEPEKDYHVELSLGYIILEQPMSKEEVLAVAFEDSSGRKVGTIDFDFGENNTIILKLIKAESPTRSFKTWDLEWKNVYYLGGRNLEVDDPESFGIKVFYQPASGSDEESQGADSFLNILGLDVRDKSGNLVPDAEIDIDDNIINRARGELILPNLRPFDPDTIFVDLNRNGRIDPNEIEISALEPSRREPAIYDTTSQSFIVQNSKFYFEVKSKNRSATYSLGFNVIEGSEEVRLGGRRLERGTDYTIDYWSGSLTVLNEQATLPNAQLDITYERNQLFQVDKKTILGSRAEYRFNDDSFIGGTLLYLSERTLEPKVRVGRGPMSNMVWDLNTSLKVEPNFLTRALDALPMISAQQPSALKFEGEIAQVVPNPNTLNSNSTGDRNGVAYIDDFEGAKRATPLGVGRKTWSLASAPVEKIPELDGAAGTSTEEYWHSAEQLGELVWFNPFGGVLTREIWPKREVNAQTGQTTEVLFLRFSPKTDGAFSPRESWAGVMKALSPGFFDQTESKFLEIMVRGNEGILEIDLGQISEDVIPNKRLDTEDRKIGGIRNQILDSGEDVGLDGMAGEDPSDWWDINGNGIRDPFEPLSHDDWSYSSQSTVYDRINGTENNSNDGERRPDTEDINGNGSVDLGNNYFAYRINLDKLSPDSVFIAGGDRTGNENGWTLYRIPLHVPANAGADDNRRRIGNPDLSLIESARIWITGVDRPIFVGIADMSLVGNEWREMGISQSEDPNSYNAENDSTVAAAVVNSHDNPEYIAPRGVEGVQDRITLVRNREQALVLDVNGLQAGFNGIVQKSFFEPQNYIHYDKMRMFVYARDKRGTHIFADTSDVEFFLRFGSDGNNYYEFRERVYGGPQPMSGAWDDRNEMTIDFLDMTSMKLDSTLYKPELGFFERRVNGKIYRMKGTPSITNIRVLTAGVKNVSSRSDPFSGQVWLNELRLSDVQKDKGIAMRARVDFNLSDFATVNAEINRQDADFHNVATRFGTGDNQTSTSINGNFRLDKFLPQSWGISLPMAINYTESRATPKYFPGKDILVTGGLPASELAQIQSLNQQRGFSLSFRKTGRSKNFFLKYTLDNLNANLSNTRAEQSNPTTEFANRTAWSGNIDYGLNFGQNTFVQPLKWLKRLPLVGKAAGTKLYYLPRSINTRVQGNTARSASKTRLGVEKDVFTYDITRSYNTTYKLFDNLTTTFSRTFIGDFREKQWKGLFTGDYVDLNKTQGFKVDYSPDLFNWLSNNFSYNSNFRYTNNIQQPRTGKSASTNTNLSANITLKMSQLFKPSSSATRGTRRQPPGRRRTPPGRRLPGAEEKEKEKEEGKQEGKEEGKEKEAGKQQGVEEEEEKKGGPDPLILFKAFGHALGKLKDINISYAVRDNYTNVGLAEGNPTFRYSLGFSTDPGVGTVPEITSNTFSQNQSTNLSLTSGFNLTQSFDVQLRFSHDTQSNKTTQFTGSYADSWMRFGKFNLPFPEWTLNWNQLEKFKLFSKFTQSMSISHNFTGKRSIIWKNKASEKTKEDFSLSFRPLFKLSVTWKNGMSSNLQINRTRGINETFNTNSLSTVLQKIGGQRTTTSDVSFSTNYSKRSGFRLPFPFLKNKELKNSVDLSVNFTKSITLTEYIRGDSNQWETQSERSSWTLEPRMTYSFSTRVRGSAKFVIGKTKSSRVGETKIREFGIDVNISIRGN